MRVSAVIWGYLCLIGAGALKGPSEVTVPYGEDLSVTCDYDDRFRSYVKYWCRGAHWNTCNIIVKSTDEKSKHRYSIEDNPSSANFIVTGRQMRSEDSDTYHCGIERNLNDNMHSVKVTVLPGSMALKGPREVTVPYGEELSVTCDYSDGFRSYVKYWCRGAYWNTCNIIVKSTDEKSKHRYSMEDNPSSANFIVTGKQMRLEDSDTYHCGIERQGLDEMHSVRVTVLPGVCKKTPLWASIVDFPPGFETIEEDKVVEVSCKKQYDNRTFHLTCEKESEVFQFYPRPEPPPCTRKCGRLMDSGQNISMYPVKEYYDQGEEVTLTCPAGYSPNHSKIRCIRANNTNTWNVTEVFCILSPIVIPFISNHSVSWRNIGVSCCLGVIPPMVVKLIAILVILSVKFSGFVKRRSSPVEESPPNRPPDVEIMKSSRPARTNLYHKVTEDQKVTTDTEDDPELIYNNMEVTENQKLTTGTEDNPELIYVNMEVTPV